MLATALHAQTKSGQLDRALTREMIVALAKSKLTTCRQVAHLLCSNLRLNDTMSMLYSITDITATKWKGDSPERVSLFKADWEGVLDNIDPNVDFEDEALKHILYDQMNESKAVDSEVKHYLRTLRTGTISS